MGFSCNLEKFLLLIFVCVYYIGLSSSQPSNRDSVDGGTKDNNQGSSYFFYQTPEYPRDCREVRDQCSSSVLRSRVFLMKPDGYPEPFEVYCNNDIDSGGWTVIQRRLDGSLDFHRNWEDYKKGFGFLSSEFWVGNELLSFLTNQNTYELRIDMLLTNGSSFHIKYNLFRISDEWGKFALTHLGDYTGDADSVITFCPQNKVYGNCTCVASCEDPLGTSGCHTSCDQAEACVCQEGFLMNGEHCVSPTECGCYVSEENRVLQNGEVYVNAACTEKCTCIGNQLNCDTNYECSSDATCKVQDSIRQCYCNEGYTGDGENCTLDVFTDCNEVRDVGNTQDGVYSILPLEWPCPAFNVFCNMTIDGGGWTVIQRRLDGSLDFHRNWEDYKKGFGFLSSEFWVGNELLSFLTNQNSYELRIDMLLTNGSSFHIKYNLFRISDEWGKFALTHLGDYTGDADSVITFCPQNKVYGNCTCVASCEDPLGTSGCHTSCDQAEACVCQAGFLMNGEHCLSPTECGCYVSEENRVLQNGEVYVNAACTEKCICIGNQLNCDTNNECSSHATCKVQDSIRQCYCNEGHTGDGEHCTLDVFTDCNEVRDVGNTQDGVYSILPLEWPGPAFNVFCNMTIDGGGWTVVQRRNGGTTGFYNNWGSYKTGFGDIQDEFWLGNDKLHYLTQQGTYELRVDFVTSSNTAKYAKYTSFRIDSETNKYRVTDIGTYTGDGGNGMSDVEKEDFSTHDEDNDGLSYDCAEKHRGGWWYGGSFSETCSSSGSCDRWTGDCCYYYNYFYYYYCYYYFRRKCTKSNLNGNRAGGNGQKIFWDNSNNCNVKYTEMKIRRTS